MSTRLPFLAVVVVAAIPMVGQMPYQKAAIDAYNKGEYGKCAEIYIGAVRAQGKASNPAVGAARCYAAGGRLTESRRYLALALSRGYRHCKFLGETPDLAALRATPDWNQYLNRCQLNDERYYQSLNAEILVGFLNDQHDREDIQDVPKILRNDEERRHLVHIAIDHRALKTADDYYFAGMIMQHGRTPDDFKLARGLAKHGMELDPEHADARWLYAAATDRYLQNTGSPQIYGTQYKKVDGRWTLEPFAPNAVTDEERQRYGVPSLAERRKFIEDLNLQSGHP